MTASSLAAVRPFRWGPVLAGGLLAGTFDIAYAGIFWGIRASVPFQRILQSVASGLLGKASFEGGVPTAVLGLCLHYSIATSMSVTYYLVARQWRVLGERPVTLGALYGVLLYGIMNFIVVPLSAANSGSRYPLWMALSVAVHAFLIGVPIALCTRRALTR